MEGSGPIGPATPEGPAPRGQRDRKLERSEQAASMQAGPASNVVSVTEWLRALMNEYKGQVDTDYMYHLPKELCRHLYSDRGHSTELVQIAASIPTTTAYGRPFEGFTDEQIRRSFHLGDMDAAPPASPPRASVRLPAREARTFFVPGIESPVVTVITPAEPEPKVEAPTSLPGQQPVAAHYPPQPSYHNAVIRAPAERAARGAEGGRRGGRRGRGGRGGGRGGTPVGPPGGQQSPAQSTPVRAPSPLVLPAAPVINETLLAGRRPVSGLTQDEVYTITEEISRKLRNKRSRQWKNTNPLDEDITPENCAELGIPNYFEVVKVPMNLKIINRKIRENAYRTLYEFQDDVELMVNNAMTFNPAKTPVHIFANDTLQVFQRLMNEKKEEYMLDDDRARAAAQDSSAAESAGKMAVEGANGGSIVANI